ncbi:M16 family metallopeptidase [Capnocytophaga periodontitidis]|uniref:M16 family metallopeptidase n=1 Tax=Capnocytophaga periodontitidis TaxID=2795027 RepID=UPI0018E0DBB2|nr:pitrilysin family protein [Capnocytophaga periodontitidis]MBI1667146.1 insulinase family protein [Capnocytophaga periodontitidis]
MAQSLIFEEYDLPNGLHVILHPNNAAPVVTIGVMYHVGAKDEDPTRTGFAHFFEHLLFEGSQNIARGKWFDIVSANGGHNNAFTTQDKTYYYEVFPSNNLQLGLWMEAERMLHPVINEIGVSTQNSVVKEEKNQRIDNAPYGRIMYRSAINPYLFKKHPYSSTVIGEVEHLDAASLEEFIAFKKKFYNPNNAVLVVAGDFDTPTTKEWIEQYFATIPNTGNVIQRNKIEEATITKTIEVTEYDPNIQIPLKLYAYRTPAMTDKDSYTIDLLSNILTDGKSARLYKKMIDEHQTALQVLAFSDAQEDYGVYIMGALPMDGVSLETLAQEMDEEITRLQTELISEREYEKLQNQIEANFVAQNSNMEGIALSLADNYTFYKDTNLINKAIDHYRAITREDIREAARKYLDKNQRLDLNYLPSVQ